MLFLVDANVLIRLVKPDDSNHQIAIDAVTKLHGEGHQQFIVPQCCYEFYVVATRPIENNGLDIADLNESAASR